MEELKKTKEKEVEEMEKKPELLEDVKLEGEEEKEISQDLEADEEEEETAEDMESLYAQSFQNIAEGEVVKGTIIEIRGTCCHRCRF